MKSTNLVSIPEPSLRRLPQYHHLLVHLQANGREVVSTTHIAADLRLDPTQVRKDLAFTGIIGRPKVGYQIKDLLDAIENLLGWNNQTEAFLVGVGHLGTALLGFQAIEDRGLKIVAAFDSDPAKVGRQLHGREVLPVEKLAELALRMHIQIGIIATPASAAQAAADAMIAGGIRGIWNFAPATLDIPEEIAIQNENMFANVAVLKKKMAANQA